MYNAMRAYPDPYGPLAGVIFFVVLQAILTSLRYPALKFSLAFSKALSRLNLKDSGAGISDTVEPFTGSSFEYL